MTPSTPDLAELVAALAEDRRAIVPLAELARKLHVDPSLAHRLAAEGEAAGMLQTTGMNGHTAAALSPLAASQLGLRLDASSSLWLAAGERDTAGERARRESTLSERFQRQADLPERFDFDRLPDPAGWQPDTSPPYSETVGLTPQWGESIVRFNPREGPCPVCGGKVPRWRVCLVCSASDADPRPRPMQNPSRALKADAALAEEETRREKRRNAGRRHREKVRAGIPKQRRFSYRGRPLRGQS
jgi:hypothetical protein